jgi:D-alanyl-D-alanine carboxypeptidase (penicillin-binding protein 5/6)
MLADLDSGQVLFQAYARERLPIASVTKIMTALLVLERTRPRDLVTVSAEAAGDGRTAGVSELGLREGEQIEVGELLYALLLQSANDAAVALAEHVSGSVEAFVGDMNARAARLGLRGTRFFSPNGLDDRGYSTASDLVTLTRAAYRYPRFARIVATQVHEVPAPEGEAGRIVQNRNVLLWLYPGAVGVKTGFTTQAGSCIVAVAERAGLRLVAVVLGGRDEVFSDAAILLNHGFAAFERREVISDGEPLGAVTLDGREIPVASGGSLVALVPVDAPVRQRVLPDPTTAFPPLPGEVVGVVAVSVPGMRIGDVPLEVVEVPPPPAPTDPGPWWRRAASSVLDAVGGLVDALFG